MSQLKNPPLLEAMCELRWGEVAPNSFQYSEEERTLFAGKVSASASKYGFSIVENLPVPMPFHGLPHIPSHRFRKGQNEWPCCQVGLGIFTINQTADGYDWPTFKNTISTGLKIFNEADERKLSEVSNTLSLVLRYHDVFKPKSQPIHEYLAENFEIQANFPERFLNNSKILRDRSNLQFELQLSTQEPAGSIAVSLTSAIIDNEPGLLMATVISSKANECIPNFNGLNSILEWTEKAHDLQMHSFNTLIKPSALK